MLRFLALSFDSQQHLILTTTLRGGNDHHRQPTFLGSCLSPGTPVDLAMTQNQTEHRSPELFASYAISVSCTHPEALGQVRALFKMTVHKGTQSEVCTPADRQAVLGTPGLRWASLDEGIVHLSLWFTAGKEHVPKRDRTRAHSLPLSTIASACCFCVVSLLQAQSWV